MWSRRRLLPCKSQASSMCDETWRGILRDGLGATDEDFLAIAVIDEEACALAGSDDGDRLGDAGLNRGQAEREAGDRPSGSRGKSLHNGADDDNKGKGLFAHIGTSQRRCFLSPLAQQIYHKNSITRILC